MYLLVEALERGHFKKQIGELIEENLKDSPGEYGGLILFNEKNNLFLKQFESEEKMKGTYRLPSKAKKTANLCLFHLHAETEDMSNLAGPSSGFLLIGGDVASMQMGVILYGESHNAVITKIKGRNFNIDYYGAEKKIVNKEEYPFVVLDLGNYPY